MGNSAATFLPTVEPRSSNRLAQGVSVTGGAGQHALGALNDQRDKNLDTARLKSWLASSTDSSRGAILNSAGYFRDVLQYHNQCEQRKLCLELDPIDELGNFTDICVPE